MRTLLLESAPWGSPCRNHIFVLLFLLVIILAAYSTSFHASWHMDDGPNITENRQVHLKTMSWAEIRKAFFSTPSAVRIEFFRPLSRLSLAMNHHFWKDNVVGYHIINVSIHVVASFFLYLFLFTTLNIPNVRGTYGKYSLFLALTSTLFWAVHPIQTQAVTYIVQRMTCMAGMFYIMSMYFYLKVHVTARRSLKTLFAVSCTIAGLLSLGSKENAILLPFSLFLFHLLVIRGFDRATCLRSTKLLLVTYVFPILLGILCLFFYTDILGKVFSLYDARSFTLWERLITESRIILLYLSLLLYPISTRFSVDHNIRISTSLFSPPSTIFSIALIIVLIALAIYLVKRSPLTSFAILFFFLNHLVESTILPLELVFEHRNYVPSMFLFLPISLGLLRVLRFGATRPLIFRFTAIFLCLLLIILGFATFLRNGVWRDEGTLWFDCLDKYPDSFRAHHNLGRYLSLKGNNEGAMWHYQEALKANEINSRKEKGITWFNIGIIAQQAGDVERALAHYTKALEVDPCCPGAQNNLAGLMLASEHPDEAEILRVLDKALECRNDTEIPLALSNKGFLLMRMGRMEEAVDALWRSYDLAPENPLTLLRLGQAYKKLGQFERASRYLNRLLDLNPRDIASSLLLAEVFFLEGNPETGMTTLGRLRGIVRPDEIHHYFLGSSSNCNSGDDSPDFSILLPYLEQIFPEEKRILERIGSACREASAQTQGSGQSPKQNKGESDLSPSCSR
jgi:protein O-mannosyl-transferase